MTDLALLAATFARQHRAAASAACALSWLPRDLEIVRDLPEPPIQCPERRAGDESGGKQIDVDPAEPTPPQPSCDHERHRLIVRDRGEPWQAPHERQNLIAARQRATRQLAQDEVVTFGITAVERSNESRLRTAKMLDPDRRVDEH